MSDRADDRDMRAAEYVLGVLDAEEARAVEKEAKDDVLLAQAIARWEERLTPLASTVAPIAPPANLWPRLEKALPSSRVVPAIRPSLWASLAFWRSSTAGGFALAAALALLLFIHPPAPVQYHAAITPVAQPAATWMAETMPDGRIKLTAMTPAVRPNGRDLELWAVPKGATKPIPMGLMPDSGVMMVAGHGMPMNGLRLLISVEPRGGSPSGQPTGPVLYGGTLTEVERS
jgi:anti-sigma-K factor RskA